MTDRTAYRQTLLEHALANDGFVTLDQARELGVPAVAVRKLAGRGVFERVARGAYRATLAPRTQTTPFHEAVLWGGPGALLSHDAVLALLDLADANPRVLRVTVPRPVRKTHPRPEIELHVANVSPDQRTIYTGVPATTVARALVDADGLVERTRLHDAAGQASVRGLLRRGEIDQLPAWLRP